jgi:hypothetical protein
MKKGLQRIILDFLLHLLFHDYIGLIFDYTYNDFNKNFNKKLDIILMFLKVLLNNLSYRLNCNFHFKGIKRNVLHNAIDFKFFSWIKMCTSMFSNVYIMHLIN